MSLVEPDGTAKEPLTLGLTGSQDTSLFLRSGVGRRFDRLNIAAYGELGYTAIRGVIENNLSAYGVADNSPLLDVCPD